MDPRLNRIHAEAHISELERAARVWRIRNRDAVKEVIHAVGEESVVIRAAGEADGAAIARLAALDGARPISHSRVLIAEVDGEVRAALPLPAGEPLADPFHRTAGLVELLRVRADHLEGRTRRGGRLRALFSRGFAGGPRPARAPSSPGNETLLIR